MGSDSIGPTVMANVDLFTSYGFNKAAAVTYNNIKVADGNLTITASASLDKALLAGIVVATP